MSDQSLVRKALLWAGLLLVVNSAQADVGHATRLTRNDNVLELQSTSGAVFQVHILQDNLFRIWAGPNGKFEPEGSRSAPIVIDSQFDMPSLSLDSTSSGWSIATKDFTLRINRSPLLFSLFRPGDSAPIWNELKPLELSDSASCQTLTSDSSERFFGGGQQNGSFEFKGKVMLVSYGDGWEEGDRPNPAPFYMSNKGYGVLRNTWTDGRYDFWSDEYLTTQHKENRFDAYYMVGKSIHEVLDLYTQLTGRAGLLPRWAFEYGDADCYNDRDNADKPGTVPPGWSDGPTGTTPDVVNTVAKKYREHDMPGGWILPNDGYGCGYKDLPQVVDSLKTLGFHTGLWTESGMDKIAWEVGRAGTRVQKIDVAWSGKGYQFALDANKDAAQGILENSDSRPFVWTVMGWAGIQRYAVTWTGDQSGSWDYIRWHIPTLIGSGLSGMIYSTGDVDGIYGGSPETFTRDLQWKCFTPVLMGMSGWSKTERKHPWWFEEPYRSINRKYLKLKMRLMPYMYTLARNAELTGAPIVRGLMWDYPNDPHAYDNVTKYELMVGPDLLIAPVYRSQAASGGWRDSVYLPKGKWIDYWDGTVTDVDSNGLFFDYPVTLDKIPIFVRAGAIIPMYPEALYDGQVSKDVLTLDIYPSGWSSYSLYEDDGNTREYKKGAHSQQQFSVEPIKDTPSGYQLTLGKVEGNFGVNYTHRRYRICVHGRLKPWFVAIDGQLLQQVDAASFDTSSLGWYYDKSGQLGSIWIKTGSLSSAVDHGIELQQDSFDFIVPRGEYPKKAASGNVLSQDKLLVVNRPAEEPGFPLENAFDDNPATWFRTVRDQSVAYGPHEFVLSLGGRRVIDGFQIAPRNDKWWQYGQVYGYEVWMSDNNGNWSDKIVRDTLRLSDSIQTVHFPPTAGRLLRFRILSVHDPDGDTPSAALGLDNVNPQEARSVKPATIATFRILEHQLPSAARQSCLLSEFAWRNVDGKVVRHNHKSLANMQMQGMHFSSGFSMTGKCFVNYRLTGNWKTLRFETGIDDRSKTARGTRLEVFGDGQLLASTPPITKSHIEKLEVDIRGVSHLVLHTTSSDPDVVVDLANPTIVGFAGDRIGD